MNNNIELIIISWNANRPLNPSIKLDPLIINKKHKSTKIVEKILKSKRDIKNGISIFEILIGKKYIKKSRKKN